jgi:hypothetical protein
MRLDVCRYKLLLQIFQMGFHTDVTRNLYRDRAARAEEWGPTKRCILLTEQKLPAPKGVLIAIDLYRFLHVS